MPKAKIPQREVIKRIPNGDFKKAGETAHRIVKGIEKLTEGFNEAETIHTWNAVILEGRRRGF
tara:strand:+ start:65 stop:253 length:189 start_codon:yes stop_codon:yes gene_type:complete